MWKKLHRPRDQPPPDEFGGLVVTQASGVRSGAGAVPREMSRAPQVVAPLKDTSRSSPHNRVPSSIYSRASTIIRNSGINEQHNPNLLSNTQHYGYDAPTARDSQYTNVSPPVSPLQGPQPDKSMSPDISPIEDTPAPFDRFQHANAKTKNFPASSLPVLRKPITPKEATSSDTSRLTRWDDFSGEPTTSDKGKPALAVPGQPPHLTEQPPSSSQKSQFSILDKGRALNKAGKKFLEGRRYNQGSDDPAHAPPQREPWKGLSGRATLVPPVKTNKAARVQPLPVPPRKDSVPEHVRKNSQTLSSSQTPSPTGLRNDNKKTIIPVAPPKDNTPSPPHHLRDSSDLNKPLPSQSHRHHEPSLEEQYAHRQRRRPRESNTGEFEDVPASRFSMSTIATAEPSSPKETTAHDAPPLPALPSEARARAAMRKPLGGLSDVASVKNLPQSPEETGASNRIEALRAKVNDLGRRRGNIETIINELTQVIQPSSIAYDLATRGEVKKTVESLNKELAEIKKDEHETGMKLMRAYKKQEKDDFYGESSVLWIKRVAS